MHFHRTPSIEWVSIHVDDTVNITLIELFARTAYPKPRYFLWKLCSRSFEYWAIGCERNTECRLDVPHDAIRCFKWLMQMIKITAPLLFNLLFRSIRFSGNPFGLYMIKIRNAVSHYPCICCDFVSCPWHKLHANKTESAMIVEKPLVLK